MFSIKADTQLSRMDIVIRNVYDEEDLKTILFLLRREVIKLEPGWTAALDLRGMRVLEQRLTGYIKKMMEVFRDQGVLRIAALYDNVVLKMQVQRMRKEAGTDAYSTPFSDEDQWQGFLDSPPTLNKPNSEAR